MRAGRPYAVISGPGAAGPSVLPWYVWVTIGGAIVGLAYLAIRRREGRDQPMYVLVDRDQARAPESPVPETALHPFSEDERLSAAFDRDVERRKVRDRNVSDGHLIGRRGFGGRGGSSRRHRCGYYQAQCTKKRPS